MIEGKNLAFSYRKGRQIFSDINFRFSDGEMISIMGPNGAGKSTLLKCINKINKPTQGQILIDGKNTIQFSDRELSRLIGYVPQDIGKGFAISVTEAVMLGRTPYIRFKASDKDKELVFEMIERFGLEKYAFTNLNELSGGERQRVFLARALVQDPKIMLLDEPISNLDIRYQIETLDLVRDIVKSRNLISIMVIHDLSFAYRYSDSVILLKDGKAMVGKREDVLTSSNIAEHYHVNAEINDNQKYPYVNPRYTL
ncbi:ABC transporter ATP-binding protein [Jingyaoa shaoxingensis]|uniref:ABC transporter ATP-binding protein n=1 Tax=Jingyaoa shaoxingensis TaxID=2763671 RepID=A0ABR7N9J6_9FIRM|nr:ABC transporter ATP-binding protein [Jingyaoa shaoxingensis]MBC8573076.1 ABC transporter ATP-binding protein [Jingyaoa shaoxingensis]